MTDRPTLNDLLDEEGRLVKALFEANELGMAEAFTELDRQHLAICQRIATQHARAGKAGSDAPPGWGAA